MSNRIATHVPCPNPTCGSSDAYTLYDNGQGHCFSCGHHTYPNKKPEGERHIYTEQYLGWRGVTKETFAKFGVKTQINADGTPVRLAIPFPFGMQYRWLREKKFLSEGDMSGGQLFGQDRFPAGSARSISIYEGALDAMSGYQMMGSQWPSVSVRSASSAKKDCADNYDYLNSFDEIYLVFDDDKPGQDAAKTVAALFDFNKVKVVKLAPFKDANDFLTANKQEEFKRVWYNAKRFLPDEVISSYAEIDEIIDGDEIKEGVSYPWPRLQGMTHGMRPGEFILLAAQEGIGKTEFMRAVEHHVLKETDANIGIIHLEEPKARAIKGLVGYELQQPVHLPDSPVSNDLIKDTFRKLTGRDNRVHIYSHFGSDDINAILGIIQFLAGPCECKFIFLDHISIVVSGTDTDDERKSLDFFSTRLKMLAESHGITLICVSHVNDDNKTRGSRNIAKVADLHVFLDRNPEAEDPVQRNTTKLLVRKNRFGAQTGPADSLHFSLDTFTLKPEDDVFGIPTGKV